MFGTYALHIFCMKLQFLWSQSVMRIPIRQLGDSNGFCTELFHQPTLMHNFLYSLRVCLLHYYPRHVSSINMPIFRRKNCIHTASGIFALCKRLQSTLVESGERVRSQPVYCAAVYRERNTRGCVNIIFPPEDGHVNARNMSRIVV